MIQEKFSLTWDNYTDHLREMHQSMRLSDYLTDVTLVTDDKKQSKAHSVVLSACSPVLKSIIENFTDTKSIIYLRGIQHPEIESLLNFMYLGETTCNKNRIEEFMNVAISLQIKDICNNFQVGDSTIKKTQGTKEFQNNLDLLNTPKASFTYNTKIIEEVSFANQTKFEQPIEKSPFSDAFDNLACLEPSFEENTSKIKPKTKTKGEKGHMKAKDFGCPQCDYCTNNANHLKVHIQFKHEGFRFQCELCDNSQTTRSNLIKHMKQKHPSE